MATSKYSLSIPKAVIGEDGFSIHAGWITTYNMDIHTREYTGARSDYLQEGVSLAAGAYVDAPKLPATDQQAVRRTADNAAWEIVPDYRGHVAYSTVTGQPEVITEMGELPDTLSFSAPQTPFDYWNGTQWVTDKDAERAAKVEEIRAQLAQLTLEADSVITQLERAIKYDLATDEEKALLEAWEKYSVQLSRVKPEDWPDISLPERPEYVA